MSDIVIQTDKLTKTYGSGTNEVHALRDVDLTVTRGELVAIMGTSGSGKSTLMNMLGCLDTPTSGSYTLDGAGSTGSARTSSRRSATGSSASSSRASTCWRGRARSKNVELPLLYDRSGRKRDTRALAVAALERVGLGERLDHQPSELSGGQQQRVAIARALVTEPALVLADEPTGNLDTRTTIEVMALFQELNPQGITIVVVTHEPDIAAYATRIVEMRDGRILRDEPVTSRRRRAPRDLKSADRSAA